MRKRVIAGLFFFITHALYAQVPQMINYQGRVSVGGTNFDGTAQFQFALVNGTGTETYWSNGTSTVSTPVTKGLYAVLLGDTSLANMAAIPSAVFTNADVRLRVWFDGGSGLQQLTPDQRIAAVGYALMSANVPDATITSNKLAAGAVGSSQLAPNLTITGTLRAGSFQGNGAGITNVPGALVWQTSTGSSVEAAPNTGYVLTNASQAVVTLPTSANVGDVVRVSGVGAGGWLVQGVAGLSWIARGSNGGWRSVASSADGTKLVAVAGNAGSGQIYTSTDSGATWTARESLRAWVSVASSSDGTKLVAANQGGQLYTSTDSGVTWTARDSNRWWNAVTSSSDGTKLVAVVGSGQIYTSTDSGATWTARDSSRNWISVASSADGTKLVAAVGNGQIYTSTDSGATWTARESSRNWQSVTSSADGSKLIAVGQGLQIYTSTDSGATWTPRDSIRNWYSVASSSDGNKLVAVEVNGRIYTSTDSGATWTARESNRGWVSVASSADGGKLVAVVGGGQIYTSTASWAGAQGATAAWQYLGNGQWQPLNESQIAAGAIGSTQLATGSVGSAQIASNVTITGSFLGNGAGITNISGTLVWQTVAGTTQSATPNTGYVLTNAAQTIVTLPTSANVGEVVKVSGVGTGGWLIAGSIIGATGPVGVTWIPRDSNRSWYSVASSADGSKLVAVAYGGQIYTSTDSGANWTARPIGGNFSSVASSADGTKLVAVYYGGPIYTSTDSGASWTVRGYGGGWQSVASSSDGTKLVAAYLGGPLYTSTDSGATWTSRSGGGNWYSVASSADGSKLVAVAYGGQTYTSTDSGTNWTARPLSGVFSSVASSADGTKLVAAYYGGPIYTSTDSGATWTSRLFGANWQSVASSADGTKLVAVLKGGYIYTSTDSGANWTPRDSNRNWQSVTSSADGSKLVAVVYGGQIYTTSASLVGTQGAVATLQYLGNGQWKAMNESQIAVGAVGSAQLASDLTISGTMAAAAFSGDGSALTNLNASQLASGTVPDTRLSANVPLLNSNPTFTGTGTFLQASAPIFVTPQILSRTAGENLSIQAANGTGDGGELSLAAGDAGNSSGGSGGNLTLRAGSAMPLGSVGYSGLGSAGSVAISGGGGYNGVGGDVVLQSGPNASWSLTPDGFSKVSLRGGILNAGDGAVLDVEGGHNPLSDGSAVSSGGNVKITAGNGVGGYSGGNVILTPGSGSPNGNVGIGTNSPVSALHVVGTVTATGLAVNGAARIAGTSRSGSETGTSETPSPAGLVVRRINSTSSTSGQVVARTDTMTLERDGSGGGFMLRWTASTGYFIVACTGVNPSGAAVNYYQYLTNPSDGAMTIYSDGQAVVYFRCVFGRVEAGQHLTEVSLARHIGSSVWCGTVTSTYNQ